LLTGHSRRCRRRTGPKAGTRCCGGCLSSGRTRASRWRRNQRCHLSRPSSRSRGAHEGTGRAAPQQGEQRPSEADPKQRHQAEAPYRCSQTGTGPTHTQSRSCCRRSRWWRCGWCWFGIHRSSRLRRHPARILAWQRHERRSKSAPARKGLHQPSATYRRMRSRFVARLRTLCPRSCRRYRK
jgi:hypothetical protein